MFPKTSSFCRVLVIAVAAVLLTVAPSQAFPRGGGVHRGSFPRSGFHGGFPHSRFHHGFIRHAPGPVRIPPGRFHHDRFRHDFFFRHGFFPRGGFFSRGGLFFPGGGFNPGYSYGAGAGGGSGGGGDYYPGYDYNSYPYYSAYPNYDYGNYGELAPSADLPAPVPSDSATAQTDTTIRISVKVPANAQLWFDGSKMTSTGTVRTFQSPPLNPGRYTYVIRARW
jgi:hypothetical protein